MPTEKGREMAQELGIPFFETSAKSGTDVNIAFLDLTQDILKKREGMGEGSC